MVEKLSESDNRLALASERFELVAKATHDVVWDWDLINQTVWWNEGIELIFGYDPKELDPGPDSWYTKIHPDDQENVLKKIHVAIDKGESNWSDYYRFRRKDGSYAYVHDRGYTIRHDNVPARMVGSMQDITEQVLLQKAQKESEERLAFALSSAQLGTWDIDPANNTIEWDFRCRQLFGFLANRNVTYLDALKHVHPQDINKVKSAIQYALNPQNDGSYNVQFRTIGADDHLLRWLNCKGQAYFYPSGELFRFSGIAQDITDQMSYREKAYFADQQATMTVEGTGAGSFLVDVTTNEIIHSPTMARIITGLTSEQLTRNAFLEYLHPDDIHVRDQAYMVAIETGELNYEARFIWKDRSIHWVKVIGRYLYDDSGREISLSGILFDITDRVETEHRIRESEEHLRSMIEQAPIATALFVGKDLIIEIPNEPMLKFWGKGDKVIGKPIREALPELEGQSFFEILDEVYRTGKPYNADSAKAKLLVNNELQTFYFNFTYQPMFDKNGQVYAIMDMAVDVTAQVISQRELKESEERYRQLADQLELRIQQRTNELHIANQELTNSNNNLQQFAYAASHDMQEPLRKIQAFSSRLQAMYNKNLDENGVFMLDRMQDAAKRMSLMIDDLLAYSRLTTKDSEFTPVDMNTIVYEVISDLEVVIQERDAQIHIASLPIVLGDSRQLVQLIQNLVSNAIKYSFPEIAPQITISCQNPDSDELKSLPNLLMDHSYVRLEITDNGIGFDEKYIDRIFQMFQRLHGKSEFNGSGIGLALCKKVVQNHHGYITAKSEPGQGSTFIIYLPQPE